VPDEQPGPGIPVYLYLRLVSGQRLGAGDSPGKEYSMSLTNSTHLGTDAIDNCFRGAFHQGDAWSRLYRIAFPAWDLIEKIDGCPEVSEKTNIYIHRKFIMLDQLLHPDVLAGGLWMNAGFSTNRQADDWKVYTGNCRCTYKED
jgi:hypothetical protein